MIFQRQEKSVNEVVNKVFAISTELISPNPNQPRIIFDDYELSQLAMSIQQNGILQPLTVRAVENGRYELITGERRLRAAKLINEEFVPCIILETESRSSAILAILENLQRADLNYIEEALAIKKLIEHYGVTQEVTAEKLGVAQSTIANKLRLLKLSDAEKEMALRYRLNERQARALLRLPAEKRKEAIETISASGLNTAQTDKLIDELLSPQKIKPRIKKSWGGKAVRLYINNFKHTINAMRQAGIDFEAKQNRTDEFIEYNIKIKLGKEEGHNI